MYVNADRRIIEEMVNRNTNRHKDTQTNRQTHRKVDRYIDVQTKNTLTDKDRHTDTQIKIHATYRQTDK